MVGQVFKEFGIPLPGQLRIFLSSLNPSTQPIKEFMATVNPDFPLSENQVHTQQLAWIRGVVAKEFTTNKVTLTGRTPQGRSHKRPTGTLKKTPL